MRSSYLGCPVQGNTVKWPIRPPKRSHDPFSDSALLSDIDALAFTSLQNPGRQSRFTGKVCLSWRFLCAALHCALYIVWAAQLQTISSGQKWTSRGGGCAL